MKLLNDYLLPTVPVVLVIAFLVLAWLTRHRPFVLSRALSVNALMSCCFAGPFLRFGGDKAVVAFLFIFVITSLFSWAVYCHYQLTFPPNEPSNRVQS